MASKRAVTCDFRVKVGTAWWDVNTVTGLDHGDHDVWGLCNTLKKTIDVRAGQQPEQELHTFLHEFLHAGCREYGLGEVLGDAEEAVVEGLGMALTQAFVNSPALLKYINERVRQAREQGV